MQPAPGIRRQDLNTIETTLNWTAENDTNLNETLKDTFIPAFKDGTVFVQGQWRRKIEHGCDYRTYSSEEELRADYPDAEAAGVSEERYQDFLNHLRQPESELTVEFEMNFLSYNGPHFHLCTLNQFIWGPLYEQQFEDLKLYGYRFTESRSEFEMLTKYNFYDAAPAEEVRKRSFDDAPDEYEASQMAMEGVALSQSSQVSYKRAWLVVTEDLDGDKIPEKYVVYWDLDREISLRVEPYTVRRNIPSMVPFRLVRRSGRLLGDSLMMNMEHIFKEINALHRHRSNNRRLSDSVTLLLPNNLKDQLDLGSEAGSFRPGAAFWLPDQYMNPAVAPRQLEITLPTQQDLEEEGLLQRYVDLTLGISHGQSGQESPQDPSAPASKTAMLLQRSDLRVKDLIDEWQRSVPMMLSLLAAQYYQNGGATLTIMTNNNGEMIEATVPTKLLGMDKVKSALKPLKPNVSPDIEMQKIAALAMAAMKMMIPVKMKPQILADFWNDFVAASRIERPERFQIQMSPQGSMAMGGQPGQPGATPVDPNNVPGALQSVVGQYMNALPPGMPTPAGGAVTPGGS